MKTTVKFSAALAMCLGALVAEAPAEGLGYDEALIPRFNIPKMSKPPTIDGTINADEWREAAKVMGVVWTGGLDYRDRPVSYWLGWDAEHLYLAFRSDILTAPKPFLRKANREKYATGVVWDDGLEVGLFLHDRNKVEGQVSSYLKFVINSLGSGEYMKNYPSIGQVLFNWTPTMKIQNRVSTDAAGKHWWEMEVAMSLKDVQMTVPHQAGDKVDIGLFAVLHNPSGFQWLDFPSASGRLVNSGFPRAILTADQPYIQVEEFSGLHDEKLNLKTVIYNPADKPAKVNARVVVQHGAKLKAGQAGELADPVTVLEESKELEIPANGQVRFDAAKDMPGLPTATAKEKGFVQLDVTAADAPGAAPVYRYACNFSGTDKTYRTPVEVKPGLDIKMAFNPVNGLLSVGVDTMDAELPAGTKAAGATYQVHKVVKPDPASKEETRTLVKEGSLRYFLNAWYEDTVELGRLDPGKYAVTINLVDADGKVLGGTTRTFGKIDAAKAYPWWNNKIENTERLLKPFEALRVEPGKNSKTAIACTRRVYELGSLGLPAQILANGGPLLSAPAHLVLKVGGKEYRVPADRAVKITGKKDWRVDFECAPVSVAGVTFTAKGWMEQDGLVELQLSYAPEKKGDAVEIEALRIEWPVDDALGLHMACMGQGSNYSARTIDVVPAGQGQVWNTKDDIGVTGSGRRVGNFVGNLWLGTEQRGLFWGADSDSGWEPHADVPAHALRREGNAVVMVNNLVGSAAGKAPFVLTEPRTVKFAYNASPFRNLADGWRLNQLSACGSFSGGKYKVNWDTKQDHFQVLSPPFPQTDRWAEYYAFCKEKARELTYDGITWQLQPGPGSGAYYGNNRYVYYLCNQIPLRGYGPKSIEEPNPYGPFRGDWVGGGQQLETLSKTYRDYMIWLMDRQVKEGGCTHFYFDISMGEILFKELQAGLGYRLPDGSIQPEAADGNMREWFKRVWAMMQENDLYPGGVSGHGTHSFSLKMLPFTDAILDSEYPMQDSIDVYPSAAMIALSCPHTFGVNVSHHQNFMNPTWPMMHDAAGMFAIPAFKQWGISRKDVEFIPYWRNQAVVKQQTPGLLTSIWKRPGSAVLAIMNYGPDPAGGGKTRAADLKLDLRALGVPEAALKAGGERVRIRQFYNHPPEAQYLGHLPWVVEFNKNRGKDRVLPAITPAFDAATGTIGGFDINYHDVKFLVLNWDEKPVNEATWQPFPADEALRGRLLDWGLGSAAGVPAKLVAADNPAVQVKAWKRAGDKGGRGNSVLFRVTNAGDADATGTIKLDLQGLDVNVRKLWSEFTSAVSMDGLPVENRESAAQPRSAGITYNAYTGELYYKLGKGQARVFSIDRY